MITLKRGEKINLYLQLTVWLKTWFWQYYNTPVGAELLTKEMLQ